MRKGPHAQPNLTALSQAVLLLVWSRPSLGTVQRGTGYLPPAPMRVPGFLPLSLPASLLALACVSEHGPLTNRMAQSTTPYLARAPTVASSPADGRRGPDTASWQ